MRRRTNVQTAYRDLGVIRDWLATDVQYSDHISDGLCKLQEQAIARLVDSESRDLDDVALKAKMLRDESLQELYDFTSNLAASIERDLARLSGKVPEAYEPSAEELAMARQATDFQSCSERRVA